MYCDEHKPQKPVSKSHSRVTHVPDVPDAPVNPFVLKAQKDANRKKTEPARLGKQKKAQESAQAEAEALEREYAHIDDRIERATREWTKSFDHANDAKWAPETDKEFKHAWNLCDHKQNALINLSTRKRILEKLVEDLTNPERVVEIAPTNGHAENMLDPDIQDNLMDDLEEATELLNEEEQFDVAEQFANILTEFDED